VEGLMAEGIWRRRGGVYIHIICALRLAMQEAGGCLTAKGYLIALPKPTSKAIPCLGYFINTMG